MNVYTILPCLRNKSLSETSGKLFWKGSALITTVRIVLSYLKKYKFTTVNSCYHLHIREVCKCYPHCMRTFPGNTFCQNFIYITNATQIKDTLRLKIVFESIEKFYCEIFSGGSILKTNFNYLF